MVNLTLRNMSTAHLVVMADGLARSGDVATARAIYRTALRSTQNPELRDRIRIRIGLVQKADSRLGATFQVMETLENLRPDAFFVADGMATWFKTIPFFEDDRFMELEERLAPLLPVRNWHWNLQVALWAVARAREVPGDLVELGVFRGHTTLFCAEYLEFKTWPKTWWLYDTFEGIPEDQVDEGWEETNRLAYNAETFTYEEVRDRFAPFPNIKVIKGRVPEVLNAGSPDQIAFLHVDMNNAAAEIAALDQLYERVSPGGVILFDDYAWETSRAQYDAERAWFAARGEAVLPLPTGQGLFVKR